MSIQIIDDDLLEGREFFDVIFSISNNNTTGATLGKPRSARIFIESDDGT